MERRTKRSGILARATFVEPMKVLSVEAIPQGLWRSEIKYDGYRAIAVINGGAVELWSRNQKPLGADYPELVEALASCPCRNAVIDGEVVALDGHGRSRFQLLQNRSSGESVHFYAFDLPLLDGVRLDAEPLELRQESLRRLLAGVGPCVHVSETFDSDPKSVLAVAKKHGLEGIVLKRRGSLYEPGRRSGAWLKCKLVRTQEFVIGGFTAPRNARSHFGALLVGYFSERAFVCVGKVGSGFDAKMLRDLHVCMKKRIVPHCPFSNLPQDKKPRFGAGLTRAALADVHWVRPELVAQVKFSEWTADGMLRQPVFLGLREDKNPKEVTREP